NVRAFSGAVGPGPMVQRKKGNTFTVVPKRSAEPQKSPAEPQQEAPSEAPEGPLGNRLKKRYPAVEEIEVIGGYLSLAKSCLSKSGSEGKKLKISFNESSLHSTYEYPSESSVWDSGEEDEEEKQEGTPAEEQPSMVGLGGLLAVLKLLDVSQRCLRTSLLR
uniref:Taperin n=1 Tax=Fundulus heteroclitus TaxID=8078 RepID=A0A3Q2QTS8_FUNHE